MEDFKRSDGRIVSPDALKTINLGELLVFFRLQKGALERIAVEAIEGREGPIPEWVRAVGDLISQSSDVEHKLRGQLPAHLWEAVDRVSEAKCQTYLKRIQ